jgi:hypothetical protein
MGTLGKKSLQRLAECDVKLRDIIFELAKQMEIVVLCGYRGEKEQNEAFAKGTSKLKFPKSKHNQKPSRAVDVAPYPIDWNDLKRFQEMCNKIESIATKLEIKIRLGRDFKFVDMPHVELEG